jgi:hypothetical protein
MIAGSLTAIVALVQMGVIETTWNSRFADVERPDQIVIDLDPGARVAWRAVIEAAASSTTALVLDLELRQNHRRPRPASSSRSSRRRLGRVPRVRRARSRRPRPPAAVDVHRTVREARTRRRIW